MNYALRHVRTIRAGQFGYSAPLRRGQVEVCSDGARYTYGGISRGRIAGFRTFAKSAFLHNDGRDKLAGRFPRYEVIGR